MSGDGEGGEEGTEKGKELGEDIKEGAGSAAFFWEALKRDQPAGQLLSDGDALKR